jgi:hypothetical protein
MDATSGHCCRADERLDKDGQCCPSPSTVDACGVCGGAGVAVDVAGTCCPTALPPSGLCCLAPAVVDSCGVCGGLNKCDAHVTIVVTLATNSTTGLPVAPSNSAATLIAAAAGVPASLLPLMTFVVVNGTSVR